MFDLETKHTNIGKGALAQSIAEGKPLSIEEFHLGCGALPPGKTPEEMDSVEDFVMSLPIIRRQWLPNGTVILTGRLTSVQIHQEFVYRELAVIASLDGGAPFTYQYGNAGVNAPTIPVGGGSAFVENVFQVTTVIANAENITINVVPIGRLANVTDSYTTTGVQDEFTLINCDPMGGITVYIDGAVAEPQIDYVIDGDIIRLAVALPAGRRVWVTEIFAEGGA